MLPSTGYFKGINCPFYDSGLCERPYCHFRHVKKESQNISNDEIESGAILQKLVSAAVQKVLQQTETTPSTSINNGSTEEKIKEIPLVSSKATYNPTPISELEKINNTDLENNVDVSEQKKRHIPVPYTPRKPTSLPIKRPVDTNGTKLLYLPPVKYTPGSDSAQIDPYTPKGSTESKEKYLPGTETVIQEYKPKETQNPSKLNYIPSDKNLNKKKILEYKPAKVKSLTSSVSYQPTPKSLVPCFSSDEDEPETKKIKISSDLNGLDDLGPEFDILDQILDEEKSEKEIKKLPIEQISKEEKELKPDKIDKKKSESYKSEKVEKNTLSKSDRSEKKSDKEKSDKRSDRKSDKKDKVTEKKENDTEKDRKEKKPSSDRKSSHKSSNKDKNKDEKKEKYEKKSHSSSKNSESSSRHSKSSKSSSKHSKHNVSSKDESKKRDKKHSDKSHKHSKKSKDSDEKLKKNEPSKENFIDDQDNHEYEDVLEEELSESDEDTIAQECKRIFEEYVPTEKPQVNEELNDNLFNEPDNEEYIPTKKRISRTIDKNIKIIPKAPIKPDFKVGAAQTMAERLAKVREFHASKKSLDSSNITTNSVLKSDTTKPIFSAPNNTSSKIRIAHVPYASTMLTAKKIIPPPKPVKNDDPSTSCTIVQTVKKGSQRVAHIPSEKFIDRPGVLEPLASKIPANIRSTYLNMMIDNCLNIYLSVTDAYARAQHEELATSKKCSTVQIYKNSAVLTISRLKKELKECNGVKKSGTDCSTLTKIPQNSVGNSGFAGSWSIENKNKKNFEDPQQFTGAKLYNNIKKWVLTEEQLKENGFPRPHSSGEKGRAIIYGQNKQNPPKGYIRTCCRCKKSYTVDKKGFAAIKEECIYHPNNKYRVRGEARYQCCSQDSSSDGCCVASSHVYEYVDFENLKGYVKTLPPETVMEDYGVYSLDCEMCYTTHGLDLTRVTVINSSCKVVYETLIKPLHPIIDYNTRYSGITEEQMSQVRTTLLEVQATLLTMFNSKTILIGHSLESDFKALKLIHDSVVDTSVLFPHKMGPPYKRALRNLSSEYLKKIIQNSVDGHDSAEDASVCMELILYKVKEDLKSR